jgi:DNA-binding PadR family transcriptional regulator
MVFHILSYLSAHRSYGYRIRKALHAQGVELPLPTVYRILEELKAAGSLECKYEVEEKDDGRARSEARPRRYFWLTESGKALLAQLAEEMTVIVERIEAALKRMETVKPQTKGKP